METRIRRIQSESELHECIDDYQIQGYSLQEHSRRHAKLKKVSYGTAGMHVLWFFLTFWWTLGIGNLLYLLYAYFSNTKEILIKPRTSKQGNYE